MSRGNLTERIVIQYPPDFDGELWIDCESIPHPVNWDYRYTFTHAEKGNTWETLVAAAKAIVAQDERMKKLPIVTTNEDPYRDPEPVNRNDLGRYHRMFSE